MNAQNITALLKQKEYERATHMAIEWVKKEPFTTQGWILLGDAYLRQGQGFMAQKCFARAALLDPAARWVDSVEAALAKSPSGNEDPRTLRLLDVRTVSVAAAILTYNEERSIRRCIDSLLDAVDEIVVLDSASTDRTIEIAKQFPKVKVIENVSLEDNFASKRNKGLEHIESDWVLWVDADEWLHTKDKAVVRTAAGLFHHTTAIPPVLYVGLINHVGDRQVEEFSLPRMFPLRRGLRYYGRVHEQVVRDGQSVFDSEISYHPVRIRLHHDGYQPEFIRSKDKLKRNIRLLERMIKEDPANPAWWHYYGREMLNNGDEEKARVALLEAERKALAEPRFGRLAEIHLLLVRIYNSRQQYDEAEAVCLRSLETRPDFPNMHYQLAQIRMRKAALLLEQAETSLKQSKQSFQIYRGIVPADRDIWDWKADVKLADLALFAGHRAQAEAMYRAVLSKHPHLDNVRVKLEKITNKDSN